MPPTPICPTSVVEVAFEDLGPQNGKRKIKSKETGPPKNYMHSLIIYSNIIQKVIKPNPKLQHYNGSSTPYIHVQVRNNMTIGFDQSLLNIKPMLSLASSFFNKA